jgi:hypothetical protein
VGQPRLEGGSLRSTDRGLVCVDGQHGVKGEWWNPGMAGRYAHWRCWFTQSHSGAAGLQLQHDQLTVPRLVSEGVSEGILHPAWSVAVSDLAETYRRTLRRSRSGSDRWVRFTPCLHGQVSWSHGGVVICDAGEMRSRPWAGGRVRGGDDGGRVRPEHCHCRYSC